MEKEPKYRLKKISRRDKKADADDEPEVYIQELRVPQLPRRQTQSGDESYYHESSAFPRHAYLHKYETRSPEEYKFRASSGPRVTRKISEPITGSSRRAYDDRYRQIPPGHSGWVDFEEVEVQDEVIRDADRSTRRDIRREIEKEDHVQGSRKARMDSRDESDRVSEGEHRLEFDVKPRNRSHRKAGKRAQTMPEVSSVATAERASVNLRRLGAGDPREYMELKYGVLVEPNEKSVEEIEREVDFEKEIQRSSSRPERSSFYHDAKRKKSKMDEVYLISANRRKARTDFIDNWPLKMDTDIGKKMKMPMEPEVQMLFSDPSDLSSSGNDSSDDQEIQALLRAASYSENVTIPDTRYEPQTEVFKQEMERRSYSAKTAAAPDDQAAAAEEAIRLRAQNLRNLERSIREREAFIASQEESLLRRQAALEERERKAAMQEARERRAVQEERERRAVLEERERRAVQEELARRVAAGELKPPAIRIPERTGQDREPSLRRERQPRVEEYRDDILDFEPTLGMGPSRSRSRRRLKREDQLYGSEESVSDSEITTAI